MCIPGLKREDGGESCSSGIMVQDAGVGWGEAKAIPGAWGCISGFPYHRDFQKKKKCNSVWMALTLRSLVDLWTEISGRSWT